MRNLILACAVLVGAAATVAGVLSLPVTQQATKADYQLEVAQARAGEARAEQKLVAGLRARGMRNITVRYQGGVRIVNADFGSVGYEQVGF